MAEIQPHARSRRRWWIAGAAVVIVLGVAVLVAGPRIADRRAAHRSQEAAALSQQSEAAARDGHDREAQALAGRAIETAPEYARRARARYFLGDEEGALADCDEAVRRDPALGLAYAYRAPLTALRAAPAAGVADADKALELMPDSAEAFACAALARLPAGDAAGALKLATRAVELNADDPEAHRARGLALAAQGDAGARAEFDAAVRLSGDRPFYLAARADYLLGRALAEKPDTADKELAQAADDADRALRADPACAPALVALADVRAQRERRFDTVAACEKAVAANPRCVPAYLRAAEDLSPRDLKNYEMLQEALSQTLDLRELKGGDFAFGALLTDLQRLASNRMKRDVTIYINYDTFAPEQRATLRDAKVNLNSLMDVSGDTLLMDVTFKTILDALCVQVGAALWVGPEFIEIVDREHAAREAARRSRLLSHDLIAPAELYRREERVLRFEQALRQTIDLREMKGGDFALGALLTEIQRLASNKMRADIKIYVNYPSFEPEQRATLRDTKVNLNGLMDASGENLLRAVKVGTILDQLLRSLGDDVKARVGPDYIEVVWTGKTQGGEAAWRPLRLTGKPRIEALRWLDRGIEQVPVSARLYRARGQVRLEQYELEAAIADLTHALERNPADRAAYRLRSLAYAARGNPGDAALARADALATRP